MYLDDCSNITEMLTVDMHIVVFVITVLKC